MIRVYFWLGIPPGSAQEIIWDARDWTQASHLKGKFLTCCTIPPSLSQHFLDHPTPKHLEFSLLVTCSHFKSLLVLFPRCSLILASIWESLLLTWPRWFFLLESIQGFLPYCLSCSSLTVILLYISTRKILLHLLVFILVICRVLPTNSSSSKMNSDGFKTGIQKRIAKGIHACMSAAKKKSSASWGK